MCRLFYMGFLQSRQVEFMGSSHHIDEKPPVKESE